MKVLIESRCITEPKCTENELHEMTRPRIIAAEYKSTDTIKAKLVDAMQVLGTFGDGQKGLWFKSEATDKFTMIHGPQFDNYVHSIADSMCERSRGTLYIASIPCPRQAETYTIDEI